MNKSQFNSPALPVLGWAQWRSHRGGAPTAPPESAHDPANNEFWWSRYLRGEYAGLTNNRWCEHSTKIPLSADGGLSAFPMYAALLGLSDAGAAANPPPIASGGARAGRARATALAGVCSALALALAIALAWSLNFQISKRHQFML